MEVTMLNSKTIQKIYNSSVKDHTNPYATIHWSDAVNKQAEWFTSPRLISLYGTEEYANLETSQQKQLSFWEAINFFSLNIHGEKALIEGLAQRLYQPDGVSRLDGIVNQYVHVFLAEENQHMSYFGGFCTRYGNGPYPDRKFTFPKGESEPEEDDFLFFVKVLIFEEISDAYNRMMGVDPNLNPIARQINQIHHHEETRHLIFGRQVVETLFEEYSSGWSANTLARIRKYISNYFASTWAEYYNPDVYRDAGFAEPFAIRQVAYTHPICQAHRQHITENCVQFFLNTGILEEKPTL
jgi:hypothetical protein